MARAKERAGIEEGEADEPDSLRKSFLGSVSPFAASGLRVHVTLRLKTNVFMSFGTSPVGPQGKGKGVSLELAPEGRQGNGAGPRMGGGARTELLHLDAPRVDLYRHEPEPVAEDLVLDDRRVVVHEDVLDGDGGHLGHEHAPEGVGDRGVEADEVERDDRGRERVDGDLARLRGEYQRKVEDVRTEARGRGSVRTKRKTHGGELADIPGVVLARVVRREVGAANLPARATPAQGAKYREPEVSPELLR